jgi:hypothetical protein
MNIQIAATLGGRLAAVGPIPVHGARHDAHAFVASELKVLLVEISAVADLGYVGVEGIEIVPFKRPPGGELATTQAAFNTALSKIRAAVEHAIAHLKTWRMLSEEGGRYRAPIEKYQSMLKAIIGLFFFAAWSGRPGESHPRAPTERNVTVSRHSALLILSSRMCAPGSSG